MQHLSLSNMLSKRRSRTGSAQRLPALAVFVVLFCFSNLAHAGITQFANSDPGVGPGVADPNSTAAQASFASSASAFGSVNQVTFEGLPLGTPAAGTSLTVAPGVTLSLTNTDHTVIPNYPFGISNASPNPVNDGYNTTPGGSQFLEFVPQLGVASASMTFHFEAPINSFGFYLTGVGNVNDDLHLLFNDGISSHDIALTGSSSGGIQFFGFTDPGGNIQDITLEERNVSSMQRDVFGVDDVQFVIVPEPSAGILLGVGLLGVLGHGVARRTVSRLRNHDYASQ